MTIPSFQDLMLPVLSYFKDGLEHSNVELIEKMVLVFSVTEEEYNQMIPSGRERVFTNRVNWSRTYLHKAGLLERTQRSVYKITDRGLMILGQNLSRIDIKTLNQFEEFRQFHETRISTGEKRGTGQSDDTSALPPDELMQKAYIDFNNTLIDSVLDHVKKCTPAFFEQLVIDLLLKMKFGDIHYETTKVVGKSGDGGIDGIIDQDRLGLDTIYIQAKRWEETTVGKPEIQKFVGALLGKHARKGIFITTSKFSQDARIYVDSIDAKIILIDGQKLAELMVEFGLGVADKQVYILKKLDMDYFDGE